MPYAKGLSVPISQLYPPTWNHFQNAMLGKFGTHDSRICCSPPPPFHGTPTPRSTLGESPL